MKYATIALLFSVMFACSSASSPTSPPPAGPRYLALGDSYTIGESVPPEQRWPVQLARKLGIPEPQIIAKTGWTTSELNAAIDAAKPRGRFDLVTLLIGVNNQYRGLSAEEYRTEFRALLKRAIGFARNDPKRVVVVSIPDWGATPFARTRNRARIAAEIDRFNAIKSDETRKSGARFVDITGISRRAEVNPALIAPDDLHPSGAMYELWITPIEREALAALGR
jgi:lysophospholipase L1-like esterase